METVAIRYRFTLPDGSQETFDLQLDAQELELLGNIPENLPSWTNLDCNQCPNCQYKLENDIIGNINKHPSHQFSFL